MPLGPFPDWNSCIAAQQKKGKDIESARRICGALEERSSSNSKTLRGKVVEQYTTPSGKFYVRAFLIDSTLNKNNNIITEESIRRNIYSFVGKPLILTENFDHPDGPPEYTDTLEHKLQFQEDFRVGTIKEIVPRENAREGGITSYYAVIEVTDDALKDYLRNNKGPVYVSPSIVEFQSEEDRIRSQQLQATRTTEIIQNWTGLHLAIVAKPAFGYMKAAISDQCGGDEKGCLLQLRNASCNAFCHYKALRKYNTLTHLSRTKLPVAPIPRSYTSHASRTSDIFHKSMSQLETIDSTPPNNAEAAAEGNEKVEQPQQQQQPQQSKSPVSVPRSLTISQAMEELQNKEHIIQLQNIKIQELTEANSTITERVSALEMQDRRKEIERIVTSDVIKDDKARLVKIRELTNSSIPVPQIEELYKEFKVLAKKASLQSRSYNTKVPYVTNGQSLSAGEGGRVSATGGNIYAQSLNDDEPSLLRKQLSVMRGRII